MFKENRPMPIPILIITYKRFDLVIQTLEKLNENNCKVVHIAVDDYYKNEENFNSVQLYLQQNGFEYRILKWDSNVGPEHNVMEGCKWFFSFTEHGIILEDDCIPTSAFFEFIKKIEQQELVNKNISFFSTNTELPNSFFIRQSYIPFFWGWYTSKSFFDKFYSFYKGRQLRRKDVSALFQTKLSLKTKLLVLINYLAFDFNNRKVGWDSILFFYKIVNKTTFCVPSYSLINNVGFGELNCTHTHTDRIPKWYYQVKFQKDVGGLADCRLLPQNYKNDNFFLDSFYVDYTANKFKLLLTLSKTYVQYVINNGKLS
jgi:GR25 family glycosyltransferase involved in LPS biosynthesis